MTKKELEILIRYENSSMTSLYDAYGRFSGKKAGAWKHCEELCKKHDGHGLRVIGANKFQFSAGFSFTDEDGNKCMMYITSSDDKKIVVARKERRDG